MSISENLARLDEIKELSRIVADPRGRSEADRRRVLERGRVVVCITPAMHASEAAGTQMGVEFAWWLATSDEEPWRSARENTVVLMPPSLNPDGLDHVRYAPTRLLYSGHISKPEVLQGHGAWLRCPVGKGQVHLFGFRPHYRSWSHQAFHLLFRAMLLDD